MLVVSFIWKSEATELFLWLVLMRTWLREKLSKKLLNWLISCVYQLKYFEKWTETEKIECFFSIFGINILDIVRLYVLDYLFFFCFVNRWFFLSLFVLLNYQTIGTFITITFLSCFGNQFFFFFFFYIIITIFFINLSHF